MKEPLWQKKTKQKNIVNKCVSSMKKKFLIKESLPVITNIKTYSEIGNMAEKVSFATTTTNIPTLLHDIGGYDVQFVDETINTENITCNICHLVLKKPVQAVPCGHRFCGECIKKFHEME